MRGTDGANTVVPDNTSIAAIKAKTDNLPASPAATGEYDARMSAIQTDLDNTDQYKADVSGLAVDSNIETHVTNSLNAYDAPTRAEVTSDKNEIITEVNQNETKIDSITTTLSSITTDITFIKGIEGGKWELTPDGTQMIFYKADNVTEIARFNITRDANNNPTARTRT
jgi:hypothetical protein